MQEYGKLVLRSSEEYSRIGLAVAQNTFAGRCVTLSRGRYRLPFPDWSCNTEASLYNCTTDTRLSMLDTSKGKCELVYHIC